jgi:hypothetical protein
MMSKSRGRGVSGAHFRAILPTGQIRQGAGVHERGLGYGHFHFKAILPNGRILTWHAPNILTDEGVIHMAGVEFLGTTQDTTWFIGLSGTAPSFLAGSTLATMPTEFTNYTEGTRQAYTAAPHATAGLVTNAASVAEFTIDTGGGTIGGAFVTTVTSGTSGVLFSGSAFSGGDVVLPAASVLQVTYITGLQDDGV